MNKTKLISLQLVLFIVNIGVSALVAYLILGDGFKGTMIPILVSVAIIPTVVVYTQLKKKQV